MAQFPTGVVIVSVSYRERVSAVTVNAFASVSLQPLQLLVCLQQDSETYIPLLEQRRFAVNLLAADQTDIAAVFADPQRRGADTVHWVKGAAGVPTLPAAVGWFSCDLAAEYAAGDHAILLGQVCCCELSEQEKTPLLYWRGQLGAL